METLLLSPPVAWLLAALIFACLYSVLLTAATRRRLPPGPWPLPLVGNLLAIGRGGDPHRSLARLAERYGPLMSVRLGVVQAVVVSSPSVARDIHQRRSADLAGRPVFDVWRGGGHMANSIFVLPASGDRWRAMRRLATSELLAPKRLDAHALRAVRQEEARKLVRQVAEHAARGGEAFEVGKAVLAASLGMLWRTMFSCDLNLELGALVKEATQLASAPNVSDFFPAVAAADLQGFRRRIGKLVELAYGIVDEMIARRMRCQQAGDGEPSKGDLLDVLLHKERQTQQEGGDSVLNRDGFKGLITDLFVAGTDTSSTMVEWAMAELLRSPKSMEKVKEELRRVLGKKAYVDEFDVNQLPYLQAVVKETLRLHPSVPLTFYRAEAATEVQGYNIPKGTTIILNLWALHRQPDVWDEPEKFDPDRFICKDINFYGSNAELIPFSAGKRMCPGLPLAVRTTHLILASLLYHFDWKLPHGVGEDDIDMRDKFGLVTSMATPLKVVVTLP